MRHLDTTPLEARIRKLQLLRELVEDPEMVQLFLEMVSSSNGHKPLEPAKTQAKNASTTKAATPRGELKATVVKIIPTLQQPFNIRTVVEAIASTGYTFQANDPFIAVGSVLKRLAENGKLKRVKEPDSRAVSYKSPV
jgi:hypothetical protein